MLRHGREIASLTTLRALSDEEFLALAADLKLAKEFRALVDEAGDLFSKLHQLISKGVIPMSLEQAIQENTAAINELIAIMRGNILGGPATGSGPQTDAPKTEATPTKEKKQSAPAATQEPKADAASAVEEPAAVEEQPEAVVVSYDDCAASVTKLAKSKGRPAAVALLGKHGLKTLQDAKTNSELLATVKSDADAELGE